KTSSDSRWWSPVSGLSNTSDVARSDSLGSGSPSRVARYARRLAPPLTAAVAAARQSPGRLPRYAAIHDPKFAATAGAIVGPSIFSFAKGTLSTNRDRGESRDSAPPTAPYIWNRIRRFGGLAGRA